MSLYSLDHCAYPLSYRDSSLVMGEIGQYKARQVSQYHQIIRETPAYYVGEVWGNITTKGHNAVSKLSVM